MQPRASVKAKVVHSPSWYEPALSAPIVSEKNFATVLLMASGDNNEGERPRFGPAPTSKRF